MQRSNSRDTPIDNWVRLDRAISLAQTNLGMSDDEYRPQMREWAKAAMENMGLFYISTSEADIEISAGGKFKKPCGFMAPIKIQLTGLSGSISYPSGCIVPTFNPFYRGCSACINSTNHNATTVNISESRDYFQVTPAATAGTMHLVYYSYPSDEDGNVMVPRYAYEAIAAYLELNMLKVRQRREGYRMIPNSMISEARQTWMMARKKAKARKNTPSAAAMPATAATWNVMATPTRQLLKHRLNPLIESL